MGFGDVERRMHRIEIRFPEWHDDGEPDRFAMLLAFMFEEMGIGFSLLDGGPRYRVEVDDLKRALDAIIQELLLADAAPETTVRVGDENNGKTYRLGDLIRRD